jgi:hypothetical protein
MEEKGEIKCLDAIALVNHISEISTETETDSENKKHKSTHTSAIIVCLKKGLRISKGSKAINRQHNGQR